MEIPDITRSEDSLYWASFSKALPAGFFSEYPCVQCQCEVESGWGFIVSFKS